MQKHDSAWKYVSYLSSSLHVIVIKHQEIKAYLPHKSTHLWKWICCLKFIQVSGGGGRCQTRRNFVNKAGNPPNQYAPCLPYCPVQSNTHISIYTDWSSRCCFICCRLFHVHSSAKSSGIYIYLYKYTNQHIYYIGYIHQVVKTKIKPANPWTNMIPACIALNCSIQYQYIY